MLLRVIFELFLVFEKTVGQASILDSFHATEAVHCPIGGYRQGKAHIDDNECALMCLMYEDCAYFQWDYPANAQDPCWLRDACDFSPTCATCTTYTRTNKTNWVEVPDISDMPGMIAFNGENYPTFDYGNMKNMDEDACALHCLLTDCVTVAWNVPIRKCWFKEYGGGGDFFVVKSDTNSHLKAVIAACVPGYSCYALLTYQNGQNKETATQHCQDAGGHLAVFDSQEELDAVVADGRFGVLRAPLWLGVHYTTGQWQAENTGSVVTVLPWLTGQPAITTEGTPATVDPLNSWGFAAAADSDIAFPFCEFTALTMKTIGESLNNLNDGDLTTCFTPLTPSEALGTTLKTIHPSAADPSQILVKVHGDGIVCSQNIHERNVHVWQMKAGNNNNNNNNDNDNSNNDSIPLSACQLTGSYMWQQKQLCLFTCGCDSTHVCSAAYLRIGYTTGVSVCEFQVL